MKKVTFNTTVTVCTLNELSQEEQQLIYAAQKATENSYAPYSHFYVGTAALLKDGTVVCGTNQENSAYPSGLCAERTTLFYAGSQYPDQPITMLAIAARSGENFTENPISPCGACRQVMLESEMRFGHPIQLLLYGTRQVYKVESASALLPLAFSEDYLK